MAYHSGHQWLHYNWHTPASFHFGLRVKFCRKVSLCTLKKWVKCFGILGCKNSHWQQQQWRGQLTAWQALQGLAQLLALPQDVVELVKVPTLPPVPGRVVSRPRHCGSVCTHTTSNNHTAKWRVKSGRLSSDRYVNKLLSGASGDIRGRGGLMVDGVCQFLWLTFRNKPQWEQEVTHIL